MSKFLQATNLTWSDSTATSVFQNCPVIHCGKLTGRKRIAFGNNVHKIAILSDELENVKQLHFRLHKFESDNKEFEKSVLIYIIVYRKKYVLRGFASKKTESVKST